MKLSDGQMPQKAGECLADQDAGYKVGDTIKLRSGTSDEVIDTLTTDTLKVVGLCSSPMYISYGRGSATIGTGTISAFVWCRKRPLIWTYTRKYMYRSKVQKMK